MASRRFLVPGVLLVACIGWLVGTGVGVAPALLIAGALALQTVSGAVLWRWACRSRTAPMDVTEALGMGFAIGAGMALAAGLLLRPLTVWGWLLPAVAVLAWQLFARRRSASRVPALAFSRPAVWGAGVAALLGLAAAFVNLARYPLSWTGTWSGYHPDMLYFEGLSDSLARLAPWDSIFVPGSWIHYHWFAFAWNGQLSASLALEPFVGLTRLVPFAATTAAALLAAGWTARRTSVAWAPGLAALLVTMGGFVGAAYGTLLNVDSPSQAMSSVWMLAAAYALLEYVEGRLGRAGLVAGVLLTGVAMGSKLSSAAVLVAALGVAFVLGLLLRAAWWKRAGIALVLAGAASFVVYVAVLAGAAKSGDLLLLTLQSRASSIQGLNLGYGAAGIIGGTLVLLLAIMPRWAGVAGLWLDPASRRSAASLLGVGLVLAGLFPPLVLSQGVNELWFALASSLPLAVLSAEGLALWWQRWDARRVLLLACAGGLVVLGIVTLVWSRGETGVVTIRAAGPVLAWVLAAVAALLLSRRLPGPRLAAWAMVGCTVLVVAGVGARLAPIVGRVGSQSTTSGETGLAPSAARGALGSARSAADAPIDYGNSWSPDEVEAAAWLHAHTTMTDVIVTDRTNSALVPALTGRRTYVSAGEYVKVYAGKQTSEAVPVFERISVRFAVAPTPDDYAEMCATGVTYGWYTAGLSPAPGGSYAHVAFSNDAVNVIAVDRAAC